MAKVDALLGVLGLTTRQHLDKAIAKKKQWHGLVRDVFAQYYLKFRESSLDNLPELPTRYSADWEAHMKKEVDEFLKLDLESAGELLVTCGLGTEKWDRLKDVGFPAFRQLVDNYLEESETGQAIGNGHPSMADITAAASEDVRLLLAEHPGILDEFVSRFNPETGLFGVTDEDIRVSELYLDLKSEVEKLRNGSVADDQDDDGPEPDIDFDVEEEDKEENDDDGMNPATAALFDREAMVQELTEEVDQLKNEIKARDHTIEGLESGLGQGGSSAGDLTEARKRVTALEQQLEEETSSFNKELKTRDYKIEQLREELEGSQIAPAANVVERGRSSGDDELAEENTRLKSDLRATEQTVKTLRHQVEKFEEDLGKVRDQLVEQVEKLSALTAGEIDIKPTAELDGMNSDQLLGYARDVAEDLDVRRQTLDEGITGLDSVKDSFEENKRVYERQELELQKQLHALRTSLDDRDRELTLAQQSGTELTADDARETVAAQRQQLELLSTRVKQLMSTNRELQDASKKTYSDLEQAVRRLMPLRKQIENLELLRDALSAYIREKYDRSFTTKKLDEVLK